MERPSSTEHEDGYGKLFVVCLYPSDEIEDFTQHLAQLAEGIIHQTSVDACLTFIDSSHAGKSKFVHDDQLNIAVVYERINLLCGRVEDQIELIDQESYRWSVYHEEDYASKDLSRQAHELLWIQLFHQVMGQWPRNAQAREQLVEFLRISNEEYQSADVLRWYLRSSFLGRTLSKALHSQDMDQLYATRYLLADLINNLTPVGGSSGEKSVVYPTMELGPSELNYLRQNQGKLIAYKGFLSAARTSPPADCPDAQLEIQCSVEQLTDRILFNVGTTFRLGSVKRRNKEWHIRLTVVDDGAKIAQKYLDATRRRVGNVSDRILFGRFLTDLCRYDQSQRYFERLRDDPSLDEDLAWIEEAIGRVLYWKYAWDEARKFYDRAYERLITSESARLDDAAVLFFDIGSVMNLQGKFDKALDLHQRALAIREQLYPANHPLFDDSFSHIGLLYQRRGKFDQALEFHQRALSIREEYYLGDHVDIAEGLVYLGVSFTFQSQYEQALAHQQRALEIFKKFYPSVHCGNTYVLRCTALIYNKQEKFHESLHLYQRALTIVKNIVSPDHPETAVVLDFIGDLRHSQGMFDQCLELRRHSLIKLVKFFPTDQPFIADAFAAVQLQEENTHDQAPSLYEHVLEIFEAVLPANDLRLAQNLFDIGAFLSNRGDYEQALSAYRRELNIRKANSSSNSFDLAGTLDRIGAMLYNLRQYEQALEVQQQALLMIQTCDSANGLALIALTSSNLGTTLYQLNRLDDALTYHEQALEIRQKQMSLSGCAGRAHCYNEMGHVFFQQKTFDEAAQSYRQVWAKYEQADQLDVGRVCDILSNLSSVLSRQKKLDEAFKCQQRLLHFRQTHTPSDEDKISKSFTELARIRTDQGRFDEARTLYEQLLTIYERSPPSNRDGMVFCLNRIADILSDQQQYGEALQYHGRILALEEAADPSDDFQIAERLMIIGYVLYEQKKFAECRVAYERVMQIYKEPQGMAVCLLCMSAVSHHEGNHHDALQLQRSALKILDDNGWYCQRYIEKCLTMIQESLTEPGDSQETLVVRQDFRSSDRSSIASSLACIGWIWYKGSKHNEAWSMYEQALAVHEQFSPPDHLETAVCLMRMGLLLSAEFQWNEALEFHTRALTIQGTHYPQAHTLIIDTLLGLGYIHRKLMQFDEAMSHNHQAFALLQERDATNDWKLLYCLEAIEACRKDEIQTRARTNDRDGTDQAPSPDDPARQLEFEIQCYLVREQLLPPNDTRIGQNLLRMATCYEKMGQLRRALEHYQRTLDIYNQSSFSSVREVSTIKMNIQRVLVTIGAANKEKTPAQQELLDTAQDEAL